MPDIPLFARERFRKPFRVLRVTDVYDPLNGWRKLPSRTVFGNAVAMELVAQGVTQVRLQSRREKHDVSIIEAYAPRAASASAAAGTAAVGT